MNTYTFHVHGMSCKGCAAYIESELADLANVDRAEVSFGNSSVTVTGDFGNAKPELVAQELGEVLKSHGYTLSSGE